MYVSILGMVHGVSIARDLFVFVISYLCLAIIVTPWLMNPFAICASNPWYRPRSPSLRTAFSHMLIMFSSCCFRPSRSLLSFRFFLWTCNLVFANISGYNKPVAAALENAAPRNADRAFGVPSDASCCRVVSRRNIWKRKSVIAGFNDNGMVVLNPEVVIISGQRLYT